MDDRKRPARWGRVAVAAALLVPLAATATATTASAATSAPSATAPSAAVSTAERARAPRVDIAWQPCGPDWPGLECATATVPLDYDEPANGSTEIALARFPAAKTARRIGSVFVNPGGPGASGVALVLDGGGEFLGTALRGRFDVVGFDPRGVGSSDPLHCFDSEAQLVEFFADLPVFPYLEDQYQPFFDTYAALGPECLDDRQEVASHMGTADVARDLDVLRQAVGDRALTYLGFSYGSFLGNTYANLFPDKVRALAIDGVLDPRLWVSGRQIESDPVATQEEFEEFLRLCDKARRDCAFWTRTGAERRWERLARALRRDPLELPDGTAYTYDFLIADVTSAMYAPEVWDGPEGAAALLDLLADAVLAGRPSAEARVSGVRTALSARLQGADAEADYDNGLDAFYGNLCADAEFPSSFAEFKEVGDDAARASQFGPLWWWGNAGCARWPVTDDRYTGPWTARTAAPVLVVGNFFDGVTGYDGAVASDRLLRNSRLLSYAGWGHTAYGRSGCVTGYVDAYLLRGSLPPAGTVCPANPNPFRTEAERRGGPTGPLLGVPPWPQRAGR